MFEIVNRWPAVRVQRITNGASSVVMITAEPAPKSSVRPTSQCVGLDRQRLREIDAPLSGSPVFVALQDIGPAILAQGFNPHHLAVAADLREATPDDRVGLPDVNEWGPDLLKAWKEFTEFCGEQVADIPRAMAWHVLANCEGDLAGRVMRVELAFTLSDADLDSAGNDPDEWDWRGMLDLDEDTELNVRRLDS